MLLFFIGVVYKYIYARLISDPIKMMSLAKFNILLKTFWIQVKDYWIQNAISRYATSSPVENKSYSKLLKQQLYILPWGYLIILALSWYPVSWTFFY